MSKPFFSIITPTYNRVNDGKLKRCLNSVLTQTFEDFEHIIVDDGSAEDVGSLIENYDERFHPVRIKHSGRVIARNAGMKAAGGEWLCHLDSDDTYSPMYLSTLAHYIEQEPDVDLWVCGAVVNGMFKDDKGNHLVPKWTNIRQAWTPPLNTDGNHVIFNSGKVGTGMFVFRRRCLDVIGYPPDWQNHNQIADGMDEWLGVALGTTGYSSAKRLVGNPFGDDHALFQKLCLYYRAHLIQAALYCQFVR